MDTVSERPRAQPLAQRPADFVKNRFTITAYQHALIRLPSDGLRVVQLKPEGTINLGKFGLFAVDGILGFPFGQSFEIIQDLKVRPIKAITDHLADTEEAVDIVDADLADPSVQLTKDQMTRLFPNSAESNQNIIDIGSKIQKLLHEEISELKKSGATSNIGQQIIEQMIASHDGFDKKTLFSQQKYLKRKQQKFLRRFTVEYLGSSQLLQYYIEKDIHRVLDLSEETLGMMMSYANVRPGGRYLVSDETGGVLIYAMLERMQGMGSIVLIHENEHPNYQSLTFSDISEEEQKRMIQSLSWLQFYEPQEERIEWVDLPEEEYAELKVSKQDQYGKRKARAQEINSVLDEIDTGNFDAFVSLSTLYMPTMISDIIGKVGGSRPIVIYNQFKEVLLETQHVLMADNRVLAPAIFETRVRPFQTIPGRLHPEMTMRGFGGYCLWGTRVFPLDNAITAIGRGQSKRKREEETVESGTEASTAKITDSTSEDTAA